MDEALMTTRQAADFLGVKETTLEQWRWNGKGPEFCKLNRAVRYRRSAVDAFANARTFTSTTEAQAAA